DRMQKKIRTAQQQKIPFMAIAGDEDVSGGTVSFRYRDGSQRNGVPLDQAIEEVVGIIRRRENAGPSAARDGEGVTGAAGGPELTGQDGAGERDAFERLWTPHRMAYIKGEGKPATDEE